MQIPRNVSRCLFQCSPSDCSSVPRTSMVDNAPVDGRWCLIHATHMAPEEVGALARSGATVGLCPVTEANLGDGIFSAVPFLAQGGQIGFGTDSNVAIGAAAEFVEDVGELPPRRVDNVVRRGLATHPAVEQLPQAYFLGPGNDWKRVGRVRQCGLAGVGVRGRAARSFNAGWR